MLGRNIQHFNSTIIIWIPSKFVIKPFLCDSNEGFNFNFQKLCLFEVLEISLQSFNQISRFVSQYCDFLLIQMCFAIVDKHLTCSTQTFVVITWFFKSYEVYNILNDFWICLQLYRSLSPDFSSWLNNCHILMHMNSNYKMCH